MTKKVTIDAELIINWDAFHNIFSKTFGFPEFYGQNMNAWIDCMTYIDDKDSGMTKFLVDKGDTIIIELKNSDTFKNKCPDIYLTLFECAGHVNERRVVDNDFTMIAIALE